MSWYPHVTVACIVENDGKFLLVEEWSSGELVLNQPAGHLEKNETLQQAAIRETLEETGWHIELEGLVAISLYTSPRNGTTYHRTCFSAKAVRHEPDRKLDDGIERAIWLSLDDLKERQDQLRSPLVMKAIETYLKQGCQSLNMIQYCQ